MRVELLVSAVDKDVRKLAKTMQIESDAVIINQVVSGGAICTFDEWKTDEGGHIRAYTMAEKGVGLSRNNALLRANADISLFGDEDIVYKKGYAKTVEEAFDAHPEADMLLFNVDVCEERRTYHIDSFSKVKKTNCGRYPAYSFAIRTQKMHSHNLTFSLLFGGGAKYSNGEDSLFILDALRKGLKVYAVPETIGEEIPRPSTWFNGYNEKFFFDRGVLYHFLYGKMAKLLSYRFILKKKSFMCKEINSKDAYKLMKQGIAEASKL